MIRASVLEVYDADHVRTARLREERTAPGIRRPQVSSLGGPTPEPSLVTIVILLVNLVVDLVHPVLDPRIRYTSGSHSSNARSKWPRGRAPTTVALGSPSANNITVGSDRTP